MTDSTSQAAAAPPAGGDVDVDATQLEGGSYELIRTRLIAVGADLAAKADTLNAQREETFGTTHLSVVSNRNVRTDNNCVPRDIVSVADHLVFGFNVFVGLRSTITPEDVFQVHELSESLPGKPLDAVPGLFDAPRFREDFAELYKYYKKARLLHLVRTETHLLAVFGTGDNVFDVRVFRWHLDAAGRPSYVDNRGERDYSFPPSHDFEWDDTTRDDHRAGTHPHVSVLEEVFVETVGGDLTIKVEDNTATGRGVYAEPVADATQSLADARIQFCKVGVLVLLRILPYGEAVWRYLVFNTRTQDVQRVDAIGQACVQLPEDQGIIFPGGYYLQTGESKVFDADIADLEYQRALRSPNGEDVLYVFYHRVHGRSVLLPYNLIRKEVANPIHCHGYTLFSDGRMVVFRSVSDEPTRVHPMQVWQTPFVSAEHAAAAPDDGSFLAKVGNSELVRGISDVYTVKRLIDAQTPSRRGYEDLIRAANRVLDTYYWLSAEEVGDLATSLTSARETTQLIVGEFAKVVALRSQAEVSVAALDDELSALVLSLAPNQWREVRPFMDALTALRKARGHAITLRDLRYVDLGRLDGIEARSVEAFDEVGTACVAFLLGADAFSSLVAQLEVVLSTVEGASKTTELEALAADVEATSVGLDVLTEIVGALEIDDPTARTQILEQISEVYSQVNRTRATVTARRTALAGAEARGQFAAQFQLLGQAVSSAVSMADTPDKCDVELTRLMVQLEEIEAQFSELDDYLEQLATKREEIVEAFGARKQALLDERQRRVANLSRAADRVLQGVGRRVAGLDDTDELNGYFASDPMVMKLRQIAQQLLDLGDSVKSDDLTARLGAARQTSLRGLRDRLDLFEGGTDVIKLGRHRFNVNTEPLELTLVPRDDRMVVHITGTDFYQGIEDERFEATRPFWTQQLVSETEDVYRAEYLAASLLFAAEEGRDGLSMAALHAAGATEDGLRNLTRDAASARYDEGYERGVHDADAARILARLVALHSTSGLLRYGPRPRALAGLFWAYQPHPAAATGWQRSARSLGRIVDMMGPTAGFLELEAELGRQIGELLTEAGIPTAAAESAAAGAYLARELARAQPVRFVAGAEAVALRDGLLAHLHERGQARLLEEDLRELATEDAGGLAAQWSLARAWLEAFCALSEDADSPPPALDEAAALLLTSIPGAPTTLDHEVSSALVSAEVSGLLGTHRRVTDGSLTLRFDAFYARLAEYVATRVPAYRAYRREVVGLLERERAKLRVDELQPRVLTSFVRNKLIDEVYLPLIGDNLAKQLGAAGESKRTDLMGMLLLISPPGYGKTTLMEYVANRLGLVFMKVNGPALGHSVTSLDPAEAPNATARQEVERINMAFEMGNNVMLYLDDIQHTHPELLQKFISLCDGQRRVEGVWRGRTQTYDLRGKKFCVIMAGNPYTESGEAFQIPDMLANRADTYNLGDVLSGKGVLFALSYIENSLTSNPVLQPLASREHADVYKLVAMARGEEIPTTELSHGYSAVELDEIKAVLQRLFRVQEVLLAVNQQYIESAGQEDAFRTEPPFKLQGSYRNMNKLAEKTVPVMTTGELESLIDDHYAGEAQTLTTGAEANVLKLRELRGVLSTEDQERWDDIRRGFARIKSMGGDEDDPVVRVVGSLATVGQQLAGIKAVLDKLQGRKVDLNVSVSSPAGIEEVLAEQVAFVRDSLRPLLDVVSSKLSEDAELDEQLDEVLELAQSLDDRLKKGLRARIVKTKAAPAKKP